MSFNSLSWWQQRLAVLLQKECFDQHRHSFWWLFLWPFATARRQASCTTLLRWQMFLAWKLWVNYLCRVSFPAPAGIIGTVPQMSTDWTSCSVLSTLRLFSLSEAWYTLPRCCRWKAIRFSFMLAFHYRQSSLPELERVALLKKRIQRMFGS